MVFFFVPSSKLSNYADDNKSYASGSNLGEIKEVLLNNLKIVLLFKWLWIFIAK